MTFEWALQLVLSPMFACFLLGICKLNYETSWELGESYNILVDALGMCKSKVARLTNLAYMLKLESVLATNQRHDAPPNIGWLLMRVLNQLCYPSTIIQES